MCNACLAHQEWNSALWNSNDYSTSGKTHYVEVQPQNKNLGWQCPKCGYCWAWFVRGCENCNKPITVVGEITWEGIPNETSTVTVSGLVNDEFKIIYCFSGKLYTSEDGMFVPFSLEEE